MGETGGQYIVLLGVASIHGGCEMGGLLLAQRLRNISYRTKSDYASRNSTRVIQSPTKGG